MAISYRIGDATAPEGGSPGVIAHVCNDAGGWGKGFVVAISRRWQEPEAAYRRWARSGQDFGLGMVQLVKVADELSVANMVAQHGYVSRANPVAIRYEALALCLSKLAGRIGKETVVHMPRIGCGLAGGSWDQIEPILERHLAMPGFDVRVYDLPAR
jgi:O-acetyl-ADP-ribose deacetylase (regulator of RNase III)